MVTVQVVCAPTDAEADRLALPSALSFLRLRQGRPGRMPTPEQAAAHPWTPAEQQFVAAAPGRPGHRLARRPCAAQLARLLAATEADELMITTHGALGRPTGSARSS